MTVIGDRIKSRRDEKSLSLAELARRAEISKGYLHTLESGDTLSPSADVLFRIARELDTTIGDLMGNESLTKAVEHLTDIDIPSELLEFAEQNDLPVADIKMLAQIEYRGKRPKTVEDWQYIYESIKRTLR